MQKILDLIKKMIPKSVFEFFQPLYHFSLAFLAALFYGFPSRKMIVIGVTGTKGKSTTSNLIYYILNSSGYKTGLATTVNFKIGDKEWLNKEGKTMLGRFQLQKLLRQMNRENCEYAVIETSSEGILQYRHRFVDYDIAIFTNLSPEHIERHAGFENYRNAKIKLFEKVAKKKNSIGIYNLDDENVGYFLKPEIKIKYGYEIKILNSKFQISNKIKDQKFKEILEIKNIELYSNKTKFEITFQLLSQTKCNIEMPLIGEFNVYNAAAAIDVALSQNIPMGKIKEALKSIKPVPGRMESINENQNFSVFVDYAHTEDSLKSALMFLKKIVKKKLIVVFGCGGDRDKSKRPKMGAVASELADIAIITSDNPRSENPLAIIEDIKNGLAKNNYKIFLDRKEAIFEAIKFAEKDDIVLIAGKGHETYQIFKDETIHFDDREIVREALKKI